MTANADIVTLGSVPEAADPPTSGRGCPVCAASAFSHLAFDEGYDWERCRSCGLVRLTAELSLADEVALQDDAVAGNYLRSYAGKFARKMFRTRRRLVALRVLTRRGRFLDIGSNLGFMTEAAAAAGYDAVGLEVNPRLVEAANARFPGRRFVLGALEDCDLGPEPFDAAYCSEVIEHVVDPRGFLLAIAARLRPGAVLLLTTPHIREYERRGFTGMKAPDHKLYFGHANLRRLLRDCGFGRVFNWPHPGKGIVALAWRDARAIAA